MRWDSSKPWRALNRERHPGVGLWETLLAQMSAPCFVVATTLVSQLLSNFSTVLDNKIGNLCRIIISSNQPWSTKSYAFLTSIHAILRLRHILRVCPSGLHPLNHAFPDAHSQARTGTTWTTYTKYLNWWSDSWLSPVNSPGFGSSVVLPSEKQAEYSMLVFAMVWNDIATPSWSTFAFFHQNLVSLSGPRALQFFFLASTFVADGGGTRL